MKSEHPLAFSGAPAARVAPASRPDSVTPAVPGASFFSVLGRVGTPPNPAANPTLPATPVSPALPELPDQASAQAALRMPLSKQIASEGDAATLAASESSIADFPDGPASNSSASLPANWLRRGSTPAAIAQSPAVLADPVEHRDSTSAASANASSKNTPAVPLWPGMPTRITSTPAAVAAAIAAQRTQAQQANASPTHSVATEILASDVVGASSPVDLDDVELAAVLDPAANVSALLAATPSNAAIPVAMTPIPVMTAAEQSAVSDDVPMPLLSASDTDSDRPSASRLPTTAAAAAAAAAAQTHPSATQTPPHAVVLPDVAALAAAQAIAKAPGSPQSALQDGVAATPVISATADASLIAPTLNLSSDLRTALAAAPTQPVAIAAMPEQLVAMIRQHTATKGEARVQLHPAELGAMDLQMKQDGQRIEMTIVVDSEATRRLVGEQFATWRERLSDAGMNLTSLDVSVRDQGTGGQHLRGQAERQDSGAAFSRGTRDPEEGVNNPTRAVLINPSSVLDFYA